MLILVEEVTCLAYYVAVVNRVVPFTDEVITVLHLSPPLPHLLLNCQHLMLRFQSLHHQLLLELAACCALPVSQDALSTLGVHPRFQAWVSGGLPTTLTPPDDDDSTVQDNNGLDWLLLQDYDDFQVSNKCNVKHDWCILHATGLTCVSCRSKAPEPIMAVGRNL